MYLTIFSELKLYKSGYATNHLIDFCPAVYGRELNMFFLHPCPNPEFDKISLTTVLVRNNEATALEGTSNISESPRGGSLDASVLA